jgi:glyoxylase-like metal-dependent hydrolase (beta-lactamase superfamily II)
MTTTAPAMRELKARAQKLKAVIHVGHDGLTEILSLPDPTILCPGHGPLTTVAQEKAHNPFFT